MENVKKNLMGLVGSIPNGVPLNEILEEYKSLTMENLDYKKFNFPSLISFIQNIDDLVIVNNYGRQMIQLKPIPGSVSEIVTLVKNTQSAKDKKTSRRHNSNINQNGFSTQNNLKNQPIQNNNYHNYSNFYPMNNAYTPHYFNHYQVNKYPNVPVMTYGGTRNRPNYKTTNGHNTNDSDNYIESASDRYNDLDQLASLKISVENDFHDGNQSNEECVDIIDLTGNDYNSEDENSQSINRHQYITKSYEDKSVKSACSDQSNDNYNKNWFAFPKINWINPSQCNVNLLGVQCGLALVKSAAFKFDYTIELNMKPVLSSELIPGDFVIWQPPLITKEAKIKFDVNTLFVAVYLKSNVNFPVISTKNKDSSDYATIRLIGWKHIIDVSREQLFYLPNYNDELDSITKHIRTRHVSIIKLLGVDPSINQWLPTSVESKIYRTSYWHDEQAYLLEESDSPGNFLNIRANEWFLCKIAPNIHQKSQRQEVIDRIQVHLERALKCLRSVYIDLIIKYHEDENSLQTKRNVAIKYIQTENDCNKPTDVLIGCDHVILKKYQDDKYCPSNLTGVYLQRMKYRTQQFYYMDSQEFKPESNVKFTCPIFGIFAIDLNFTSQQLRDSDNEKLRYYTGYLCKTPPITELKRSLNL